MTRDWLLTLLAMSPLLLAATILVVALIWKPTQNGHGCRAAKASEPHDGVDLMEEAGPTPRGAASR